MSKCKFLNRNQVLVNMCLPPVERSGTLWTALAHIITAVIGSGVLSLAWSMSQLGWIAGPLTMSAFASVTLTSALFLCNCYKHPDHNHGPHRNGSYLDAVGAILGKKNAWVCGIIVRINFIKLGIVYTITSAISMRYVDKLMLPSRNVMYVLLRIDFECDRAIQRSNCYHYEGHNSACKYGNTYYMIIFGGVQVIVSQIPDFRNIEWLSVIAATMSFMYSTIGAALGLAKIIENGEIKGSIAGNPASTPASKVWAISQALGDIAFAFPFSVIFLEIMDTLRSNPPEKVTMKKASILAVITTTFFYLCCGGFGYAAFGDSTPGNLLTGFGFYEPYWLIDFANACVVLHLVGGYQVFSQPLFASVEKWFREKYPNSRFVTGDVKQISAFRLNPLSLCFRTAYVAFTTGFSILFPYFNQVVGLAGAINFWPIVVYFPVEMYLAQNHIGRWTKTSVFLRVYCFVTLIVILFAFVGSIKGLITARFS
ncbi:probable amino acid permease 7 isoform X2 [Henckelia pumila]|uniref:probable amino acid permease 7 isoform X2 n=1 Tax=Henckelia pumila TaxID=405737 RepID=UPI003C6E9667